MNDNNHKLNDSCAFADRLVEVIYDEADSRTRRDFDLHLQNCSGCREEFAAFSFVRNAVTDWRENDFANLATPAITLPFSETAVINEKSRISFFDKFLSAFSNAAFNWKTAAVSCAALILAGFLFFYANPFSRQTHDLAVLQTKEQKPVQPEDSQTSENQEDSRETSINTATNLPAATSPEKIVQVKTRVQPAKQRQKSSAPTVFTKKRQPPRVLPASKDLEILADDTDERTIRLTDLLEEIEPSI